MKSFCSVLLFVLFCGVPGFARAQEATLTPMPDPVGNESREERVINCCDLADRKLNMIEWWESYDDELDMAIAELAWVQENFPENHHYEILLLCEIAGLEYLLDQLAHNIRRINEQMLELRCG